MSESSRPRWHYGWVVVAAAFVVTTLAFGTQYTFGVFFKPLQEAFGWSRGATSWVISLNVLGYAIFAVIGGWAADRYSPRLIIGLGGLLVGAGVMLSGAINSLWQLYLLYGIPVAIGMGPCWAPVAATVSRWFPGKKGIPLGMAASGVGMGTMVMMPLANSLIAAHGWRIAFVVVGAVCLVGLTGAAQFLRKIPAPALAPSVAGSSGDPGSASQRPGGPQTTVASPVEVLTLSQALHTRNLQLILGAQVFIGMTLRLVLIHTIPYATDMGISPAAAALAVSTIGGFSIVGRLVMGFVQDRIGPRRALLLCASIQGVTLLFLPFITTVWMLLVFAVVFGFTYGGDIPQFPALTAECYGLSHMGSIYGAVALSSGAGGLIGPIMAGYIFDATSSYLIPFMIGAAALFIGVGAIYRVQPPVLKAGPAG